MMNPVKTEQPGIDALNTGLGDMEIRWKTEDPMEQERARRIITDMLHRGYALFMKLADGTVTRVKAFDPKDNCYIIADGPEPVYVDAPEVVTEPIPLANVPVKPEEFLNRPGPAPEPAAATGKRGRKKVPANRVVVTAVGRNAGG